MKCSLYAEGDECEDNTYSDKLCIRNPTSNEKTLLSLRSNIPLAAIHNICTHHDAKLLKYYTSYQKKCCDPLDRHQKPARTNLKVVTLEMHQNLSEKIIPGQKICRKCLDIMATSTSSSNRTNGSDYSPGANVELSAINPIMQTAGLSPIKAGRLSSEQVKRKLKTKTDALASKLQKVSGPSLPQCSFAEATQNSDDLLYLLNEVKEKYSTATSYDEKVKLLTLAPRHWSARRTAEEFSTTLYMVQQAVNLQSTKGILADRGVIRGTGYTLTEETLAAVLEFYQSPENVRVLPGKKDFVSVKTENGRQHKQKMLILCNLKELHQQFTTNTNIRIGFSKFASLRPEWCVLAGASGTHTVCVCIYHQNVKLKVAALKQQDIKYRNLMEMTVCNSDKKCMLRYCSECPNQVPLREFLQHRINDDIDEVIFRQWIATDSNSLKTISESRDEFIDGLCEDIFKLTKHDYIAQAQSRSLNDLKANLSNDEAIVLLDFSENYSFVVQEEIQSAYWSKNQATIHPYCVYHISDGNLVNKSYCVISDDLIHSTSAVYTFTSKIIGMINGSIGSLRKIYYFSDGAASQYKNK